MGKREFIQAIALSVVVFGIWILGNMWWYRTHPQQFAAPVTPPATTAEPGPATTQPGAATTQSSAEPTTAPALDTQPATTQPTTQPASVPGGPAAAPTISATVPAGLHPLPATQPSLLDVNLGSPLSKDPNYALQLSLTPVGAAVAEVTLNDFPAVNDANLPKDQKRPYTFESPIGGLAGSEVLATRAITIDGGSGIDLGAVPWTLVARSPDAATFSIDIGDASGPVARVTKTYRVFSRTATANTSKGFEISVEQNIASLRPGRTLKVRSIFSGPTPPPAEIQQGTDRTIMVGYNEAGGNISIKQHYLSEFKPDAPSKDLTKNGDGLPFGWAGQVSSYFCAIVLPDKDQSSQFSVHADAPDPQGQINRDGSVQSVALTFETVDMTVAADRPLTLGMTAYFGPKWRKVLESDYYRAWPRKYSQILTFTSGFCGSYCTSSYLIYGLVAILTAFHWVLRDWGLAIIGLVLLVRTLLHPITKRSQTQMMKMGKMGPEIEKLKKKYADRPDELNREMVNIYKQQGGAMLGCLPMFLQTPIWIALWTALQGTFELRQEPFLFGWTWIKDLAKPDALVSFGGPVKILFFTLYGINILPLLMAAVTYINQRYFMPMPIAATPEQESQQRMQRRMSLIFPLMFYSLPSGLNLYYLTSMSLGILESKIIRDHIREREEAEKAGKVFVPTRATRARRRDGRPDAPDADEKPGLMAKLMTQFAKAMEEAQKRAEEVKRDQEKRERRK